MKKIIKLWVLFIILSCITITFTGIGYASDSLSPHSGNTSNIISTADSSYYPINGIQPILITDINNYMLNMEFVIKNNSFQDYKMTFTNAPYYNYIIYDENGTIVYNFMDGRFFLPVITEEVIGSGKELVIKDSLDLSKYKFIPGKIYKVVFETPYMAAENIWYNLSDTAYFRMPSIYTVQ